MKVTITLIIKDSQHLLELELLYGRKEIQNVCIVKRSLVGLYTLIIHNTFESPT